MEGGGGQGLGFKGGSRKLTVLWRGRAFEETAIAGCGPLHLMWAGPFKPRGPFSVNKTG